MSEEKVRLSKLMSEKKLCSRREADAFIEKGWVLVDGHPVTTLGIKVYPRQQIALAPQAHAVLDQQATIILNKPVGYVSGQAEKGYLPAVALITPDRQLKSDRARRPFKPQCLKGLAPAGRLDIDSYGLLVLTQDGRVAKALIGSRSLMEKEYQVRVEGTITEEKLKHLRFGLTLDGRPLKKAVVMARSQGQVTFILKEGKKRQIRRMCEAMDLKVVQLKRVRIGRIELGQLPLGQWRYLAPNEHF